MNRYIGLIYKIFVRVTRINRRYVSKCKGSKKWVYISYIPEVFYKLWDEEYTRGHQSRREMVEKVKLFNRLGYNVFVSSCNYPVLPNRNFDVVFGVEPTFVAACKKYPKAKKIYYATGAYWGHQNGMIKKRTDEFNLKHRCTSPYRRLVKVYNHLDLCDKILQIGSKYTLETYPEEYRNKITLIHQSNSLTGVDIPNILYAKENEYIWIGGGGSILKGLDLVLDYFNTNPDKHLHVVGTVEDDVMDAYEKEIKDNITFHGYMNLFSFEFKEIVSKCNVMVYPSCTEGMPGSVINAMYYGLIPIVSRWAAMEEINHLGAIIEDLTIESIADAIGSIEKLDKIKLEKMKNSCHHFVKETFNIERFAKEFKENMSKMIMS